MTNKILLIIGFQAQGTHQLRPEDGVGHYFHALAAGPLDGTHEQSYGGVGTFPAGMSENWFRGHMMADDVAHLRAAKFDDIGGKLEFVTESKQETRRYFFSRSKDGTWSGRFEIGDTHRGLVTCAVTKVNNRFFWPTVPRLAGPVRPMAMTSG
jgi:hypothetical protein